MAARQGPPRRRIGALLIGFYDGDGERRLRFAGKVGTGFSDGRARDARRTARARCAGGPPPSKAANPSAPPSSPSRSWSPRSTSPSGRSAGTLRHPSYKGLRDDKPPEKVVREEPS